MRPWFVDLVVHVTRLLGSAAALALAARIESAPAMVVASGLMFLEGFALTHDLMHGALRLPRRVNEVALALAGCVLLMSGHALRRTHRVHHARPLAGDDVEGRAANTRLLDALVRGPAEALVLRAHAFATSRGRERAFQLVETALNVACTAALLASGHAALVAYALVALGSQATMSLWAAYIPHNAPAWLTSLAARLTWTGSPTMLSLAYHELHHARPMVSCRRLAAAARLGYVERR